MRAEKERRYGMMNDQSIEIDLLLYTSPSAASWASHFGEPLQEKRHGEPFRARRRGGARRGRPA